MGLLNFLAPFREPADKPPCDCEPCARSWLCRSLVWLSRLWWRVLLMAVVPLALVGGVVDLWKSIHERGVTERAKNQAEADEQRLCVEQVSVFDQGDSHTCRPGAKAEVRPTGFGSRQMLLCHCPEPELPRE